MATAVPATPVATTTVPLPDYQVSGAAAHPRSVPGSVGPFFGVLAAVLLLTALSCFFGRVCSSHAQGGDERYDCTRLVAGRRRCWWWRGPRRPVRPAEAEEETKEPAAAQPLPEP